MVDGVEDVLIGDAVLARRVVNLHTLIVIRKDVGEILLQMLDAPVARRSAGLVKQA
jgi:hypothetical protein